MSAAEELRVVWSPPGGQTPPQCLEYEVQLAEEQGEAKAAWAVGSTWGYQQPAAGWGGGGLSVCIYGLYRTWFGLFP